MRIVEVETKNHKVIGDIHLKTEAEIVSFIGRNGSGKSFLLFILHPNGSSDRYSNAYPIIVGKTGLKRIVFKDNYGVLYETLHEYTPAKNDKHSCKSYLNIIENGIKRELNQNGHVLLYQELVEKYLHFNSSVADICYITSKVDGLTSATPKRRKEIIESTNYSTVLKTMQDNVQEELRNHKSLLKVLGDRRAEIIGTQSKKEIEDTQYSINQNLKLYNESLDKYNKERLDISVELKEKENLSISSKDLYDINKLIDILNKTGKLTYNKLTEDIINIKHDLDIKTEKINSLQKELIDYNDKLQIIKNKEYIENEIKELVISRNNLSSKLNQIFNITDLDIINDRCKSFRNIIPFINNVINNMDIDLGGSKTFRILIDETKEKLKLAETFINKYEILLDETDSSFINSSIDIMDNCNTCPLYNKFIKRANYIKENESRYNTEKDNIITYASILEDLELLYTDNNKNILTDLYNILTESGRTRCGVQKSFEEIYNINKQYDEITNFIISTIGKLKDIIDNIKYKEIELNSYDNYDKVLIENKIISIKSEIESFKSYVTKGLSELDNLEVYNNLNINDEYKTKSLNELTNLVNTYANKVTIIENLKNRLNIIESSIVQLKTDIDNSSRNLILVEHKLKTLNETVDSILKYTTDIDYYNRAKTILTTDIPILMLQNNLEFMKTTTNKIFEDNNIDIVIDMESNGKEIVIPVFINGEPVPDIRHVSQGENCLISLLLNACMCHLIGYNIIYLDEIDANLDIINKEKFNNIVYSILNHLNIDQIFCISHNISSNIDSAKKFVLGNPDPSFTIPKDAIRIIKN